MASALCAQGWIQVQIQAKILFQTFLFSGPVPSTSVDKVLYLGQVRPGYQLALPSEKP